MITEDYVSLETAKLLKEKGFNEECYLHYSSDGKTQHWNYQSPIDGISAPTLQMAAKWLREKHKLHVEVRITNHSLSQMVNVIRYYWLVVNAETAKWKEESTLHNVGAFNTMEEALDNGIKYVLENMIKDEHD